MTTQRTTATEPKLERADWLYPTRPEKQLKAARPDWAPLNREALDRSKPLFLVFLATLALAISFGTTIALALQAEVVLRGSMSWRGGIAGFLFSLLLTAGQWYFSDEISMAYLVCLAPDVAITCYVLDAPAILLATTFAGYSPLVLWLTRGIILVIAVFSARSPETVLFGTRR